MSGDLMHKGIADLAKADAKTLTKENLLPVYQQETLQVMQVTLGDLIAMIKKELKKTNKKEEK